MIPFVVTLAAAIVMPSSLSVAAGDVHDAARQWALDRFAERSAELRRPTDTSNVYVTVRSVQAHISATAGDDAGGWQELAPQLVSVSMHIDLFSKVNANCVLAQLGSASLPVGSYQQIRLLLVSNSPAAGAPIPSPNACAGNGFNCVFLDDGTIHELLLSSQDNTGLKIPPGQIVGGPIQVTAGQSVDLNIDFNACASIPPVPDKNGMFRLKPTLTAAQVSTNNSGLAASGRLIAHESADCGQRHRGHRADRQHWSGSHPDADNRGLAREFPLLPAAHGNI
jgi:hypothetical protein